MKKRIIVSILLSALCFTGCTNKESVSTTESVSTSESVPSGTIVYRYATKEEAIDLYLNNEEYYDQFSLYDLQYKTQNKNGTIEELKEFGKEQMMDFTEEEKEAIDEGMMAIEKEIEAKGYHLPELDEIVFIKSTQHEENDSGAYTHGTQIYIGDYYIQMLMKEEEKYKKLGQYILAHELFHCLTRCNPEFREEMYKIIHFTVQDNEYEVPECIYDMRISNPDVEHRNAYATFNIDGKDIDCFTVLIASKPFEKEGDSFFSCMETALVPVDGTNTYYTKDDTSNFWEIFGQNTKYVIDPEECMADNFGYTLAYGKDKEYESPEIIDSIIEYLQK